MQYGEDTSEQSIDVSPTKVSFNIELKSAAHLQQLVVFNVTPADALVELDGRMLVVNGGQAMELVKFGTYSYSVAAANYHSETGVVTVNDNRSKKIVTVNLKLYISFFGIFLKADFPVIAPVTYIRVG